jgi:outer membrane scaffolding protein for murein synthesis (MipA/OmpV family)
MTKRLSAGLAAGLAMLCGGAAAQELIPMVIPRDANIVGLGVFSVPDFYGSGDKKGALAPIVRYQFSDTQYVQVLGPEVRVNVMPYRTDIRVGPLLRFRRRRDDDVNDDVVSRMKPVATATEIGAFIDYHMPIDPANPLNKWVFSADVAGNTTGVYSGLTGDIKATYWYPFPQGLFGKPLLGAVGFGLYGSDVLLFPEQGFRPYTAQGGLTSFKIPFSLTSQVDPKWLVTLAGRYEKLLNDAKDSPVVKDRGDENQFIIGIAASYLF